MSSETSTLKSKKTLGRRFRAIILPPSGGKSLLVSSINKTKSLDKKDTIFVDVDAQYKPEGGKTSIDYFPQVKKDLLKTYAEYRKFRVVLITSNRELVRYLKIDSTKIFVYYPSSYFFSSLLASRGFISKNPRFSSSEFGQNTSIPKIANKDPKTESQPINYSLTSEKGQTQSSVDTSGMTEKELSKRYDAILLEMYNTRDELAVTKGAARYNNFKQLLKMVGKDLYR